jgi:AcrR family transcriptional regulator
MDLKALLPGELGRVRQRGEGGAPLPGRLRTDGRVERSRRARVAIAEALLDLLDQGVIAPTANQIAEQAKVSTRLVFHHFADIDAIYATAADQQLKRLAPLVKRVDPALPFQLRVREFVRVRARLFERFTPVRRASVRLEPFSAEIARKLSYAHQLSRDMACQAFEHELDALPQGRARDVICALDAVSSWENWEFLRRRAGLSLRGARRVLEQMVTMVFAR